MAVGMSFVEKMATRPKVDFVQHGGTALVPSLFQSVPSMVTEHGCNTLPPGVG